jgi:hypothetical protein
MLKTEKYEVRLASIIFVQNFIEIGRLLQNLNDETSNTDSMILYASSFLAYVFEEGQRNTKTKKKRIKEWRKEQQKQQTPWL